MWPPPFRWLRRARPQQESDTAREDLTKQEVEAAAPSSKESGFTFLFLILASLTQGRTSHLLAATMVRPSVR